MALPASGAISLANVNVELGFSSTATIALNDAAVRTLFAISSGAISMSDGYNKSASLGYIENFFSVQTYQGNDAAPSDDKRVKNVEAGIPLGTGSASFINSAGNENSIAMHLTGDTLTDSEGGTWTDVGNNPPYNAVSVNTGTKKYGTGSLYFNGDSKLRVFLKRPFNGRHEKWTLEFWVNPASTDAGILIRSPNGATNWYCRLSNNQFQFWTSGGTMFTPGFSATNTWSHIAVTNDGTNLRVFINGSLSGTTALSFFTSPADTGYLDIGEGMTMYLDDVRVTLGTPLYTSAGFTAPTAALTVQPVVTGIGGMVWVKNRTSSTQGGNATDWALTDTVNGPTQWLATNQQSALRSSSPWPAFSSFHGGGVTVGSYSGALAYSTNYRGDNYAAFLFGKSKKFFDIVSLTTASDGAASFNHNLGSVPGFAILKSLDTSQTWYVQHRSMTTLGRTLQLNSSAAEVNLGADWLNLTSTTGSIPAGYFSNSNRYVLYLFAHNAGGYGLTGTDNVISCGSFTETTTNTQVTLGYEPQWILFKPLTSGDWYILDQVRGLVGTNTSGNVQAYVSPNSSAIQNYFSVTASTAINSTGFQTPVSLYGNGTTYVYVAIRRPMKVPTVATTVFTSFYGSYSSNDTLTTNFPVDLSIYKGGNVVNDWGWDDRIRSTSRDVNSGRASLRSNSNAGENDGYAILGAANFDNVKGVSVAYRASSGFSGGTAAYYLFKRASGFFDTVCYPGNGVARTISHNLGVVPQLMIVKGRAAGATEWSVYAEPLGATDNVRLNEDGAASGRGTIFNDTAPTASVFSVGTNSDSNNSSLHYVAYLFATCPGVSKVGSYTGTGGLQTINCGFTTGARFVLIKRTNSTGGWFVWDSVMGISSSTDPYLLFNSTAGRVTGTNYVDTDSTGFKVTAAAPAELNASGGAYIFLAIA